MKILFICKYNVFRSRVAEEYFKKINKNPRIRAISRGIIMGSASDKEQRQLAKKLLGIDINKRKALPLTMQELNEYDLIIVTADDIPRIIFNHHSLSLRKVLIWKIRDEQRRNRKNIKTTILLIQKKVDELNKILNERGK